MSPQPSLTRQVVSGTRWVATAQITTQLLNLLALLPLARLLVPGDFGLVSMVAVFIGFAALFSEMGFAKALIQRQDLEDRHLSSVFWANLAMGSLLTLAMFLAAPLVGNFYREPRLVPLTRALSLNFTLAALNHVQIAALERDLRFRPIMFIEVTASGIAGLVAIASAASGFGAWSLIIQTLTRSLVAVSLTWHASPWRPAVRMDPRALRDLSRFSLNNLGNQAMNYWVRNGDNLLIGRFTDAVSLGFYTAAYSIMMLPVTQITRVLSRVMFPALSRIQHDRDRVKDVVLRAHRVIAMATMPLMAGLLVLAGPFVLTVFGSQWVGMTPILQVLCLVALKQPVNATTGWIFQSQGRTDLEFRWTLISGILTLASFAIGVRWGALGVAVAYAIRTYAIWYHSIAVPGRLIGLTFGEYLRNLSGAAGVSIVTSLAVWAVGLMLPVELPAPAVFVICASAGFAAYFAVLGFFRPRAVVDLLAVRLS